MGTVRPVTDGGKVIYYDARASVWVDGKRRQPRDRFYLSDHPRRTPEATRRAAEKAAQDWVDELEADSRRGAYRAPAATMTVLQLAREWQAVRSVRAGTQHGDRVMIDHHLAGATLGTMQIGRVRPSHVRAYIAERQVAETTRRNHVSFLKMIFRHAVDDGLLTTDPTTGLKRGRAKPTERRGLSVDEVRDIADRVADDARGMVWVQAMSGLRAGELRALRLQDIYWADGSILVAEQITERGERSPVKNDPRRVYFEPGLLNVINSVTGPGFPRDREIFTLSPATYRRRLLAVGVHSHLLRHHHGSVLLHNGVPVQDVAAQLGDTIEQVCKTYAHQIGNPKDRIQAALRTAWCDQSVTTGLSEVGSDRR